MNTMLLPYEILNIIFYYTDNAKLVLSFKMHMSYRTIKHLLRNVNNNILIQKNMLQLFTLQLRYKKFNWHTISSITNLPSTFILKFATQLNWGLLNRYQTLHASVIRKHIDKIDWHNISSNKILCIAFIREFHKYLIWDIVCYYQNLPNDIIIEFSHKINWGILCINFTLDESILQMFVNKVNWDQLSIIKSVANNDAFIIKFANNINWQILQQNNYKLTDKLVRLFPTKVNWNHISKQESLSDAFIIEHHTRLNWTIINNTHTLSEQIITIFPQLVNWTNISARGNLTEAFIMQNAVNLNWHQIKLSQRVTLAIVNTFVKQINWYELSKYKQLPDNIIHKYATMLYWHQLQCYQTLSLNIIRTFTQHINWNKVSRQDNLTTMFIIEFHDKLNWKILQNNYILHENIISKFPQHVNWKRIKQNYNLYNILVNHIIKNINWRNAEYYKKNTHINVYENILYKNLYALVLQFVQRKNWKSNGGITIKKQHVVKITDILIKILRSTTSRMSNVYVQLTKSSAKKLLLNSPDLQWIYFVKIMSVDFIRKYKHCIDWKFITQHQVINNIFAYEFKNYIVWKYMCYDNLTQVCIKELRNYIVLDLDKLCCLHENVVREFKDTINMNVNYNTSCTIIYSKKFLIECYNILNIDAIINIGFAPHSHQYYKKKHIRTQYILAHCTCNKQNLYNKYFCCNCDLANIPEDYESDKESTNYARKYIRSDIQYFNSESESESESE